MMNRKIATKNITWREAKALTFLSNFLGSWDERISDNDGFLICEKIFRKAALLHYIRRFFPAAERKLVARFYDKPGNRGSLDYCGDSGSEILRTIWNVSFTRQKMREMFSAMAEDVNNSFDPENDLLYRRWSELSAFLHLDESEAELLLVSYFCCCGLLEWSGRRFGSNFRDRLNVVAHYCGKNINEVKNTLKTSGRLFRYKCVDEDLDISNHLANYLEGLSDAPLSSHFYQQVTDETLPWDFFSREIAEHGEVLRQLLLSGKPANILLYGAPGTGKTSFAKALAEQLSMKCYSISQSGFSERRGAADSSNEFRFAAVEVCDSQVEQAKSIILVDEADNMLSGTTAGGLFPPFFSAPAKGDKGQLNSVLDHIGTSTIWITNSPAEFIDESSRRRFDYSIRFEPLNKTQRLVIWKNNVRKLQLEDFFSDALLEQCATRYPVSAGGITMTLENLKSIAPDSDQVETLIRKLMAPHCKLLDLNTKETEDLLPAKDYSLEGLNIRGDIPPELIVNAVRKFQNEPGDAALDRPRMNLLLFGPPGTGKTEFVKYLGSVLDTRVVVLMGSDLLDKYVGGTEQNIKAAFARAEAENAILFLDEIDGIMQSRERAVRNWEVSQVNELLHQMENFRGIMIGATNFMQHLDAAVMRRFTFKLGFDYLDNAGKKIFFERMFRTKLNFGELKRLDAIERLTPGDFRTVRQSLYYLEADSNDLRLSSLEQESAIKQKGRRTEPEDAGRQKIGF